MNRPSDCPILCLNLARRPDRRIQAWQQFRREKLDVARIVAPDAMHVTEARGWRNKGARACAAAHRLAWREARRAGAEAVMVFEDDVVLCRGFRERLENLELPEDWAVVYFGCVFRTPPEIVTQGLRPAVPQSVPAAGVGGGEEQAGGTAERQPGRAALPRLLRVTGPTWDMHGYMIRRRVWEEMGRDLAKCSWRQRGGESGGNREAGQTGNPAGRKKEDTACDVILAEQHGRFPAYAVWPPMAWQVTGLSNNENSVRGNYRADGTQAIHRECIRHLPGREDEEAAAGRDRAKERSIIKRWGEAPAEPILKRTEAVRSLDVEVRENQAGTPEAPRPFEVGLAGAAPHQVLKRPAGASLQAGRGILISPYSAESERMAYAAVRSLRLRNADLPVLVLAQDYLCGLDWRGLAQVKSVRAAEPHRSAYMWFNKLAALGQSPFAETVFVDCDFYFARDPSPWFDLLGTDDFTYFNCLRAAADIPDATFPNLANVRRMREEFGVAATPIVVGGGHFFLRAGSRGRGLLDRVGELMRDAMEIGPASLYHRMAGPGNVPASDELAASIAAVEQQIKLPVLSPGSPCPVGMFICPHQREEVFDFPHGEASFYCTWAGGRLAPDAVHFAAHSKQHTAYQNWISVCCDPGPGQRPPASRTAA